MRKYQGVISLVIFLLIVFLAGIYAINTYGNKEEKLEINFVSDYPIAVEKSKIPNEISVFFDKFELSEIKTEYDNKISFRRIDLKDFKSVSVSNDETSSLPKMYFKKDNDILDSYKNDTLNRVYYYLFPPNSLKYDNIKTFNNASTLREHIATKLSDKSLFNNGKVLNKITILFLSGEIENSTVSQTTNDHQEGTQIKKDTNKNGETFVGQPKPEPIKIPEINVDLKVDGNTIYWNSELSNVNSLKLKITPIDGDPIIYDVTNESSKYHHAGVKGAGLADIELIINDDQNKFIGNRKKQGIRFKCS
jgi:hypothetical protein